MTHNNREIDAQELFDLLNSIEQYIDEDIQMYALGGTALTILGIKSSTRDIDINIDSKKQFDFITKLFEQLNFKRLGSIRWLTQEGLVFDLFYGSNILGTELLSDCLDISKPIKKFGKLSLFTLSLYDVIISKLARGDERDFMDIKSILEKEEIDLDYLIKRYYNTMNCSTVSMFKQKLLDLIEIKFLRWNFNIDKKLINGVKKWPNQ